ncbi:unnamed protein product [Arabidopsis arenosa]|uniref:RING-type E3 ubiquitin transferase n=1 Tax=Arabidopsis arenosa TaxID=38785 RepID=A0A8S1ZRS0_ARAAE|nr:unnamed protein product [Arabidopsis arenosa]
MDSCRSSIGVCSIEEKRMLELKSLLNWLTQRNFDKIKDEIVHTIRSSPSAFILKTLVSCVFEMAMVENSYVLFARLCVELFHELPPLPSDESHGDITTFERLFLRKCRIELENSYPKTEHLPLVYVDESNCYRFIKTVRVLGEVFKNKKITETTRKSIIQVLMNPILPPERITDAMNLFLSTIGKLADFHFSDENFNQLIRSSRAVELERNYNDEVKLRKEAEDALVRKKEEVEMMEGLLESYKEEQGKLQLQAKALEHKHEAELRHRKETETLLAIERERLEKVKIQLETVENEMDDTRLKAEEFERKYEGEMILRIGSENALVREKKELEEVKLLLETYKTEQESLTSEEVMNDPHFAADGFTYEAESIRKWFRSGHQTSPMTNLQLPHLTLVPNRALRNAIEELFTQLVDIDKIIKDEIVHTIGSSPSAVILKVTLYCLAFLDMESYVARICVELFHELPHLPSDESQSENTTLERKFLRKSQIEHGNSSPKREPLPHVYVDESNHWRFIKTVRVLAEDFKDKKITETSIIQAIELENKYNDKFEVKLREGEDALARKKEEVEMMERLLESYKEEQGKLQLQVKALEHKHEAELQLMKETEIALAIERDYMRWKAEYFESEYNDELARRREDVKALEGLKQLLETVIIEKKNLNSQVITWQDKYDQESIIRKKTEDSLSTKKLALKIVKGFVESYKQETDAMRQEKDNALKTAQETDVMEDPHMAADGFTYELVAIKKWISTGHKTSPMTNLKLSHLNLVPNRALFSAIQELL